MFLIIAIAVWVCALVLWWLFSNAFRHSDMDRLKSRLLGTNKPKKNKAAAQNASLIQTDENSNALLSTKFLKRFQLQAKLQELLEQAGMKWSTHRLVNTCLLAFVAGGAVAWLLLPPQSLSRIGTKNEGAALGVGTVLGARAWDRQHRFRVVLGPLPMADYLRFLPGGASLPRLVDWIRNYVRDPLEWDLNLQLRREEVPRLTLERRQRLGYTTWLLSGGARDDAKQLVIKPVRPRGRGQFQDQNQDQKWPR